MKLKTKLDKDECDELCVQVALVLNEGKVTWVIEDAIKKNPNKNAFSIDYEVFFTAQQREDLQHYSPTIVERAIYHALIGDPHFNTVEVIVRHNNDVPGMPVEQTFVGYRLMAFIVTKIFT